MELMELEETQLQGLKTQHDERVNQLQDVQSTLNNVRIQVKVLMCPLLRRRPLLNTHKWYGALQHRQAGIF